MTTIGEEISKLRLKLGAIRAFDDDSVLSSDEALYQLLNDAGAVIYKRLRDKFYVIPDFMYTSFAVKLQLVNEDLYACEDIPERCKVLESTFDLPLFLYGRNNGSLKVYAGEELALYSNANQFDDVLSNKPSYSISNNRLRIYNNKVLKAVTVKAVWHDILDWENHKYCPDTDTVECWDINNLPYPLYSNPEYSSMAHDIIIQSLGLTIQNAKNINESH